MKQVLLVDDDASFLLSLSDGLSAYAEHFNVLTAANGKEAISVLESHSVDLVITDLKMPVMDGFSLLAHLTRYYPSVRIIVMTAFGTSEIEQRVAGLGSSRYLEKPVDFDDLTEKIFHELDSSERGFISGFSLPSFLQLVEMEKKSYALKISSRGREGYLFFVNGSLMDARTVNAQGMDAALDIVRWKQATIEIKGSIKKRKDSIGRSIGFILIEALRRQDERSQSGPAVLPQTLSLGDEDVQLLPAEAVEQAAEKDEVQGAPGLAIQDAAMIEKKLKELESLDGFYGAVVVSSDGQPLAVRFQHEMNFSNIGSLIAEVMLDAQEMVIKVGMGSADRIHIETGNAHIFGKRLEKPTDGSKVNAHHKEWFLILVCSSQTSIGMAKVRLSSVETFLRDAMT